VIVVSEERATVSVAQRGRLWRDLTPQQLRVLDMLRKGLQNKQIAYELKICETTVKVHVSDILRKLSVFSRTNAIIEIAKIDFASLAGGAPGKRAALAHAEIMMHQPSGGVGGVQSDIAIRADMLTRLKRQILEITAEHTGQPVERVQADADRDRWFSPEQAVEYALACAARRASISARFTSAAAS